MKKESKVIQFGGMQSVCDDCGEPGKTYMYKGLFLCLPCKEVHIFDEEDQDYEDDGEEQ